MWNNYNTVFCASICKLDERPPGVLAECEEWIDGCYVELAASLDICKDRRGIPVDPFGQQLFQGLQGMEDPECSAGSG